MRRTSKYPQLQEKLRNLLSLPNNQSDYETRVFKELEGVIPSFDRDKNRATQLFRMIDNSTGLRDEFTVDEFRSVVKLMIRIGYNVEAINSAGESIEDVAFDFGEPEVMAAIDEAKRYNSVRISTNRSSIGGITISSSPASSQASSQSKMTGNRNEKAKQITIKTHEPEVRKETSQEKFDRLFNELVIDAENMHLRRSGARSSASSNWNELQRLINESNIGRVEQGYSVLNLAILFGTYDQLESLVRRRPENLNLTNAKSVLSSAAVGTNIGMRDFLLRQELTFSVLNAGFEEAIRGGKRGGNQGFADKILEAVKNAAKNPEIGKRLEGGGKYFVLENFQLPPKMLDDLRGLNIRSGKHIKPQVIEEYCSELKKIFSAQSQSKEKKIVEPVSETFDPNQNSDQVSIEEIAIALDQNHLAENSSQVSFDETFYQSLEMAGIDLKRDFAGLYSHDSSHELPIELPIASEDSTVTFPAQELRHDAPAFVPKALQAYSITTNIANSKSRK